MANETLWNCLSRGPAARIVVSVGKRDRARDQLSKETVNNYRVGFVGVHDGRDAAFVFVDFWGNENELFHRAFLSRDNNPEKLSPAKAADSSVYVWDLHLQSFERAAWIKHVLREPDAPDFDGYLAERLHEEA